MIYEQRTLGNERVDTIRITLDTPPDLIAQYAQDGYTEVMEHYLVLYKPPEKVVLKEKLDSIAAALPDEIAVSQIELYPQWAGGVHFKLSDRVRRGSTLYRVNCDHIAQLDIPPESDTPLYQRIGEPNVNG